MIKSIDLKKKSYAIYGLGLTGKSVIKFLYKKGNKNFFTWDDNINNKNNKKKKLFSNILDQVDFIILSPGIDIFRSSFKNKLLENKKKIITDLDLFFIENNVEKSIVITGTNGKSTTCSLINHILKKNSFLTCLAGNIGKPILDIPFSKYKTYIIEASSFQLAYSKFIKPKYALILNITKDHLDWHRSKKNYIQSKFKIFENQSKNQIAILGDKKLKSLFKTKRYSSKLKFLGKDVVPKEKIENEYLKLDTNSKNIEFAYAISKYFKIKKSFFFKSIKSFKGLPHRQEIFLKRKKVKFINDSKATTFESTKSALINYNNIIWILGGLPKLNDKIEIKKYKNKIIKTYIIGRYSHFFKKQLQNQVNYTIKKNLESVVKIIIKNLKNYKTNTTVLFSPASASFDQYRNFVERGNYFKKIVNYYAKKSL